MFSIQPITTMELYTDTVRIYEILRKQKFKRNKYKQYVTNSKTNNYNYQTRPMIKYKHPHLKNN